MKNLHNIGRPSAGRVSGVVEETPGTLEYEVALYRDLTGRASDHHQPVDQAVPIGEKLQLRARINTDSGKKTSMFFLILENNGCHLT